MGTRHSKVTLKRRAYGAAVLHRFATAEVPSVLRGLIETFAGEQQRYETAVKHVIASRRARDLALAAVSEADAAFDLAVDAAAEAFVRSGLSEAGAPFAGLIHASPADIKAASYKRGADMVRDLSNALAFRTIPASAREALEACVARAKEAESALRALTTPQLAYEQSIAARDALLPSWERALRRLRDATRAQYRDDRAAAEAFFTRA
ncbi:MAG: hypothetical protein R3A52_02845 [Polyangiales bacterium]